MKELKELSADQVRAIIVLKGHYKAHRLTFQQHRTLRGQIFAGQTDAALRGLKKILTRREGEASGRG